MYICVDVLQNNEALVYYNYELGNLFNAHKELKLLKSNITMNMPDELITAEVFDEILKEKLSSKEWEHFSWPPKIRVPSVFQNEKIKAILNHHGLEEHHLKQESITEKLSNDESHDEGYKDHNQMATEKQLSILTTSKPIEVSTLSSTPNSSLQ